VRPGATEAARVSRHERRDTVSGGHVACAASGREGAGHARGGAHLTVTRSSSADHRHFGLPVRSQFSAGARNEPSARKTTSLQLFQFHRVSLSHAKSWLMPPLEERVLRFAFPSPSTMHSLRGGRGAWA
jgi:hypothetical protein